MCRDNGARHWSARVVYHEFSFRSNLLIGVVALEIVIETAYDMATIWRVQSG